MTQDYSHPTTPPPELVEQWLDEFFEWLDREGLFGESRQLRAARRPKPPSLKEPVVIPTNTSKFGES